MNKSGKPSRKNTQTATGKINGSGVGAQFQPKQGLGSSDDTKKESLSKNDISKKRKQAYENKG